MKNLLLSLCLLAFMAITSNAVAQSTGTAPYPGATHTYSITPVSGTTVSYEWKVYDNSMVEVASTIASVANPTASSTTITWGASAVATTEYLVVVKETVDGCSNTKALPVVITESQFDLVVAGGSDACYTSAVTVGWNGGQTASDVTYDHGVATVVYTVTPAGVGSAETWSFTPNMTYDQTGVSTSSVVVSGSTSGTINAVSGVYTLTGTETATITVIADNNTAYDNSSALTAQNYNATMTLSAVASGTGSVEKDSTNNTDAVGVSRPSTTQITTN